MAGIPSNIGDIQAIAETLDAAGAVVISVHIDALGSFVLIAHDGWPVALQLFDGLVSQQIRQDCDDAQTIHHHLTLSNSIRISAVERRSINAA